MCLILLGWQAHPDYPLVVAANRDEFYERPTAPAQWWTDSPNTPNGQDLLAGRDLSAGGTWLGLNRNGRFAALTNFRAPSEKNQTARSRGELPLGFLLGQTEVAEALAALGLATEAESDTERDSESVATPPLAHQLPRFDAPFSPSELQHLAPSLRDYARAITRRANRYNGYNLLQADLSQGQLAWVSNRASPMIQRVKAGVYGLSNALLDTPWSKVQHRVAAFASALAANANVESYFELLANAKQAPDDVLPSTGVSLEWERLLSAAFIRSEHYGTRASTVLRVRYDGHFELVERSFNAQGQSGEVQFSGKLHQLPLGEGSFYAGLAAQNKAPMVR